MPGQAVAVLVDTGSSELWANPNCAKSSDPTFCRAMPRFTMSTSLIDLNTQGQMFWDHGVGGAGYANFQYVVDYIGIGCRLSPFPSALDWLP